MISRICQLGGLVLFLAHPALFAHDFWIEPSVFSPVPGTAVSLRLKVGDHFQGRAFPRNPTHIVRFFAVGPSGQQEVRGIDGIDPAGYILLKQQGLHIVGYESTPQFIELEAAKFESYLKEEGLERIIRLRASRGESQKAGREVFSRCAKSLIWAETKSGEDGDREIGLSLELKAEKNPYLLRSGEGLPIRLLFRGKPLEGSLITAMLKGQDVRVSARSDAQGTVRLPLSRPGIWLVKSVHTVAASTKTKADWESFWASLTFKLAE